MNAMNPISGTDTALPNESDDAAVKMTPLDKELAMDRVEELAMRLPLLVQQIEEYWYELKKARPGDPLGVLKYNVREVDLISSFLGIAYDTAEEIGATFGKIKASDEAQL